MMNHRSGQIRNKIESHEFFDANEWQKVHFFPGTPG
jgi:hypothetical protein